jgi:hypothetical protein
VAGAPCVRNGSLADGRLERPRRVEAAVRGLQHRDRMNLQSPVVANVRDGRNLIATDRNGVELWRAKPVNYGAPERQDCFTAIRWDGVNLTAHTSSCYKVSVDPDSGEVTVLEFTKLRVPIMANVRFGSQADICAHSSEASYGLRRKPATSMPLAPPNPSRRRVSR